MTDAVTCEDCRFFERDTINPPAGIGLCRNRRQTNAFHSGHYPSAPHYCRLREEHPDAEPGD